MGNINTQLYIIINNIIYNIIIKYWGKGWWDFRISDMVKTPEWNWYLTPVVNFGEVRRPQLSKSTLLTSYDGARGMSFKVCSKAKEKVGCGKQCEATAPIQFLVKLKSWFPSLRWKTCLRQNCNLGSCACSEDLSLGRALMVMMIKELPNN